MKPPPRPIKTPNVDKPTMSQWRSSSIDARSAPTIAFTPTVVIASHKGVLVARSGRKFMSCLGGVATPLKWCIDRDGEQHEQHSIQQNWSPNKFIAKISDCIAADHRC